MAPSWWWSPSPGPVHVTGPSGSVPLVFLPILGEALMGLLDVSLVIPQVEGVTPGLVGARVMKPPLPLIIVGEHPPRLAGMTSPDDLPVWLSHDPHLDLVLRTC